jgi:hypothetical protein
MNLTPLQSAQSNWKSFFNLLCRSTVVFGFWFALIPTADSARIIQNQFVDKDGQIVRFYKPEPYSAGALILPREVRGDYYLYSPVECTDSKEGFENRLHIDKYQIHFGSIASCKAKSITKAGKLYRMKIRCNHEEGTSSQSRLKIMLTTNGLLVDGDAYKKCATKL